MSTMTIMTPEDLQAFCRANRMDFEMLIDRTIQEGVEAYILRDNSGSPYIGADWSWDDIRALKSIIVGAVLPEVLTDDHRKVQRELTKEAIADNLWERCVVTDEWFAYSEEYAYDQLVDLLGKTLEKDCERQGVSMPEWDPDKFKWRTYFRNERGIYIDPEFHKVLDQLEFDVNIFCAVSPDEPNEDFVSIPRMPVTVEEGLKEGQVEAALNGHYTKNFARKMLEAQGYTMADYFVNGTHGAFIDSMHEEYEELFAPLALTAILAKVDYDTLIDLYSSDSDYHEVGSNAMLGFYSPFDGSGSMLDLKLEKPLVIKPQDIWDVQIEGDTRFSRYGYWTIQDTYGLVPECWQKCIS